MSYYCLPEGHRRYAYITKCFGVVVKEGGLYRFINYLELHRSAYHGKSLASPTKKGVYKLFRAP